MSSQSASTGVKDSQATLDRPPLPDGWHWAQLKEVCERIDYGFTASADFKLNEPRFLRITDIQNGRVDWQQVPGCKISANEEATNQLADGDIVFARTGGTTGKSFLIRNPPRAVFASYLIRLRPVASVDSDFLHSFFQSDDYWKQIRSSARGGAQPNVNATLLGNLYFPLPPLPEQKRIAAILKEQMAAVERARAAAEAQLKAAQDLPAAYLRKVFESPEARQWQEKKIGDVCGVTKLAGFEYTKYVKYVTDGEFIALRAQNVRNDGLDLSNVVRISRDVAAALYRSKLDKGDVVMTFIGANIGEATWIDESDVFYCAPNIAKITPNTEFVDPRFLAMAIQSHPFQKQIQEINASTAQQSLSMRDIRNFTVSLPPVSKQKDVAAKLLEYRQSAKSLREKLHEQLDAIYALPAILLRQAFTGKL